MAVSYLAVEIFEHEHQLDAQFRAIPNAQRLQVLGFDHLPPSTSYILSESYICIHALELTPFGLEKSLDDWKIFKEIKDNGEKVLRAIKMLSGRQKMPEDEE